MSAPCQLSVFNAVTSMHLSVILYVTGGGRQAAATLGPEPMSLTSARVGVARSQGQPQGVMATGGVDLHMTTIGEKLQEASFYTAWFGKWCVRAELDLTY